MSAIYFVYTRKLLQAFDYMLGKVVLFLRNLAFWQRKRLTAPLFFHDSHLPKKSICRMLTKNLSSVVFYTNTTKNCIHFLCKDKGTERTLVG